jgi:hypothetical protein
MNLLDSKKGTYVYIIPLKDALYEQKGILSIKKED